MIERVELQRKQTYSWLFTTINVMKRQEESGENGRSCDVDTTILALRRAGRKWTRIWYWLWQCWRMTDRSIRCGATNVVGSLNCRGTYAFDDSRVTSCVDESEVVSSAAYWLYYKRQHIVSLWLFAVLSQCSILQHHSLLLVCCPSTSFSLTHLSNTAATILHINHESRSFYYAMVFPTDYLDWYQCYHC